MEDSEDSDLYDKINENDIVADLYIELTKEEIQEIIKEGKMLRKKLMDDNDKGEDKKDFKKILTYFCDLKKTKNGDGMYYRYKFEIDKNNEIGSFRDNKSEKDYRLFLVGNHDWDHSPELIKAFKNLLSDILSHGDVLVCKYCHNIITTESFDRIKLVGDKHNKDL